MPWPTSGSPRKATVAKGRADAVVVQGSLSTKLIADFALEHRLPAASTTRGFVDNRPGGNATGVTIFGPAAVTKHLQLLHELLPHAIVIAYLMNPSNPNADFELSAGQEAAHSLGIDLREFRTTNESELESVFATMSKQQVNGLIGASDTVLFGRRDQIISMAEQYRIPAIYYLREFAQAGCLMTYGNSIADAYRLLGNYVGRILKGEKPADLPVLQSTKFEFVINLKTAEALGLTVPLSLHTAADEVIE